MTRTNAPVVRVHVPSIDAAAKVQVMERPGDLDDYVADDGTMDADAHLDVIADHFVEPDLDRDDVEKLTAQDAAALFDHITQDATNHAAVPRDSPSRLGYLDDDLDSDRDDGGTAP